MVTEGGGNVDNCAAETPGNTQPEWDNPGGIHPAPPCAPCSQKSPNAARVPPSYPVANWNDHGSGLQAQHMISITSRSAYCEAYS